MRVFERKQLWINTPPRGQRLFSPKHPDYEKTRKIYWPLPVGHIHTTPPPPRRVPAKRQPKNPPTHTNEQPRHEVEEATSGQSNQGKTIPRWRQELTRNKPEPIKNTTQAETQKKKARTKKTTNPKNASTRDKLDRKKVVCQTPNTKKSNKESLTPSKDSPRTWNKNMFCGWKKSTKEKRNNDSVKGHFRKDPRKANKMKYFSFHCFLFKCARGAGEKKKHKLRKRRNNDKNHNSKNNQTRYMQRSRKERKKKQ